MIRRYAEASGMYRNYIKVLSEWLHDRPQKFTRHCTERLASAKAIKKERYRSEEHGKFNLSGPELL